MNSPTHTVYSQHTPIPTPKKTRKISTYLEVPGVHGDNPGVPRVNPGGQGVNLGGLDVNPEVLEVLQSAQDNIHGMKAQRCHFGLKFLYDKKKMPHCDIMPARKDRGHGPWVSWMPALIITSKFLTIKVIWVQTKPWC